MSSSDKIVSWGRVFPTFRRSFSKALRRGAWYPVVRDNVDDRVSIKLGPATVAVPRRLLEIRPSRPVHFSVVTRVGYQRGRTSLYNLGQKYSVCPVCSARAALFGHPDDRTCKQCGHSGEVGWWDA